MVDVFLDLATATDNLRPMPRLSHTVVFGRAFLPTGLLHISIRGVEPLLLLEARRWALTGREPPGAAASKAAPTTQHPIVPPYESAHRLSLTTAPPVAYRSGAAAARCRSL
eukprot:scaffold124051_cov57-Phaeocystis_antarctica.AAC.2